MWYAEELQRLAPIEIPDACYRDHGEMAKHVGRLDCRYDSLHRLANDLLERLNNKTAEADALRAELQEV